MVVPPKRTVSVAGSPPRCLRSVLISEEATRIATWPVLLPRRLNALLPNTPRRPLLAPRPVVVSVAVPWQPETGRQYIATGTTRERLTPSVCGLTRIGGYGRCRPP